MTTGELINLDIPEEEISDEERKELHMIMNEMKGGKEYRLEDVLDELDISKTKENEHYFTEKLYDAKSELTMMASSFYIPDAGLEAQFKEDIINWLEKFQLLALESLLQYYNENKLLPSLLSEILELVGDASLNDLDQVKIDLLKYIFTSENLEIRHGAVEGISNLIPQFAIPTLEEILKKEDSIVLKTKISSYIEQLKKLVNR